MSLKGQTAYVTGAASGLGRATAEMLVQKGIKVFLADINETAVEIFCSELNGGFVNNKDQAEQNQQIVAHYSKVDTADWNSQAKAFSRAVAAFEGRVDHVYPIAGVGERRWMPLESQLPSTGFEMPDLDVLDVNLKGPLYTIALAVQQFRRQGVDKDGRAGTIGCVASVCGFYAVPTLPVYTAAKHGLVGFIRSYGKHLESEKIYLNGVCPNVVRTSISTPQFYDSLEARDLLTPVHSVPDTFAALLNGELKDSAGELFEVGPNYGKSGTKGERWVKRCASEYLDEETGVLCDLMHERGRPLQSLD